MWNLLLSENETMIAEAVREYLARELPLERLRPNANRGDPVAVHKAMAELGWFGVGLPESVGGAGQGLIEEMLIQREFGRYLVSPATLAIVLGSHVALAAGDTALVSQLVNGERSVGLALPSERPEATVRQHAYAFDWQDGQLLLAWTRQGMGLFQPDAFAGARADICTDDSVGMHSGTLNLDLPLHWIAANQTPLVMRARVLLAAALTGLAEHACDLTVDYAKVRTQFGKPIGSFQAVKHRCADMGLRMRLARYQTSLAALKVQAGSADMPMQVASAAYNAIVAAHENARAAVQMHGGIGFQAECDVHWFVKRAHVYDQLAGGIQAQCQDIVSQPMSL
jgi:alkylation response protein AidB-like acyl-CoA dehydrogenase